MSFPGRLLSGPYLSEEDKKVEVEKANLTKSHKTFKPDEEIPCKSVTPWELNATGVDKNTVYHWEYL